MSIQWTLIAGVMYIELAATVLLLIPVISPNRYATLLNSCVHTLRGKNEYKVMHFHSFLGYSLELIFSLS